MNERFAFVEAIQNVYVQTTADFPVAIGELVSSTKGEWYGSVYSSQGSSVRITPLDSPEQLKIGDHLHFLGSSTLPQVETIPFGSVIDPLGRILQSLNISPSEKTGTLASVSKSFWGLGRLEQAYLLKQGKTILLMGDEKVDSARFLAKSLERQHADCLYVVCQGGLRELSRFIDAARLGGALQRTIFLWSPPWQHAISGAMIAHCLTRLITGHQEGSTLILFDDLRRWLERIRETSEESPQLLMPHGFSPETRGLLTHLMELPHSLANTSLLCGWSRDPLAPRLRSHPFGPLVEHLTDTGLCLSGDEERYRLTSDSWGTPLQITKSKEMLEKKIGHCDDERKVYMELLQDLIDCFYLEVDPNRLDDEAPFLWSEKEHLNLEKLLESSRASSLEDITVLQNKIKLASLERYSKPREIFEQWLNSRSEVVSS